MTVSTKKHQILVEYGDSSTTQGVFGDEQSSLLQNLLDNNVDIDHSCGGFGTCGTCCVQVLEGFENLTPVEAVEAEMKQDRAMEPHERLCCQSYLRGAVKIKIR